MSAVSTAARSRRRAQEDGLAREKAVVVDLEAAGSPVAGGGDSRRVAPIPGTPAGTQGSPIDVEALVDGEGSRNRRGVQFVVDLEVDTVQQGCNDDVITVHSFIGSKRRREQRASIQRNNDVRLSRSSANVAPNNIPKKVAPPPKEPAFTCSVCLNKLEQASTTTCGHVFCENCIKTAIKAQKKCPTCRKKLGPRSYHRVYLPTTTD